jgi:hypothetical protein
MPDRCKILTQVARSNLWTQPGAGTTVSVRIPLRDHEPKAMGPGTSHASLPELDRQESTL